MFLVRFKNPYRIEEPTILDSDDVDMCYEIPYFSFSTQKGQHFCIYNFDQRKILAPKGIFNLIA